MHSLPLNISVQTLELFPPWFIPLLKFWDLLGRFRVCVRLTEHQHPPIYRQVSRPSMTSSNSERGIGVPTPSVATIVLAISASLLAISVGFEPI